MPRPGGDDGDGRKIFVGGLPFSADEHSIREDFGKFGEIEDVYLPRDKELDRPRVCDTGLKPQPSRLKIDLPLTRAIPAWHRASAS